jgi:hypothetical protein
MAGRKSHENFTPEEKEILLDNIKEVASILENKKTDSYTNKKKQQAWTQILANFNSRSDCKRTVTQIKGIWKRMKIKAKKDVAQHRKSQKITGGGEEEAVPDEISQAIVELLPGDFKTPHNPYDDDAESEDEVQKANPPASPVAGASTEQPKQSLTQSSKQGTPSEITRKR